MYKLRYYLLIFWFFYVLRQSIYIIKYFKSGYKEESGIGLFRFLFNPKYFSEGLLFMRLEKIKRHSKILTNLLIPTKDGFTEIDMIYININGFFMITSRNYTGWIYGFRKSIDWTRKIFGLKQNFSNLIIQNEKKISFLQESLPDSEIQQLIIFNKRCDLKNLKVNRRVVIKEKCLERRILKHKFKRVFSEEEVDEIYLNLKVYANKDIYDDKAPIDRVIEILKKKLKTTEEIIEEEN